MIGSGQRQGEVDQSQDQGGAHYDSGVEDAEVSFQGGGGQGGYSVTRLRKLQRGMSEVTRAWKYLCGTAGSSTKGGKAFNRELV